MKKRKNTDAKQVAKSQPYEVYYISGRYHIPLADVRAAMKAVGTSRRKIYKWLREECGYTINA